MFFKHVQIQAEADKDKYLQYLKIDTYESCKTQKYYRH
jgi:hypothetical protein